MQSERSARPERRSPSWIRQSAGPIGPAQPLDERSMRALEILISGLVLMVVALLSIVQPSGGASLGVVEIVALGGVLFVVALVSLIR